MSSLLDLFLHQSGGDRFRPLPETHVQRIGPRHPLSLTSILAVAAASMLPLTAAEAQRPIHRVQVAAGSGFSVGTGQGSGAGRRSPFYVEGSYHMGSTEAATPWFGIALRAELEGRSSVAAVPSVQIEHPIGPLRLRPHAALPFFFAPFSLLGGELGLDASYPLGASVALTLGLRLDAFFWGSDLPEGTSLVMLNAMLSMEMQWEE